MQKLNEGEPSDGFGVFHGEVDGFPLVAVINLQLRNFVSKRDYPWFLSVSTPLSAPNGAGLPASEEIEELDRWEGAVELEVKAACNHIFAGRLTWNGHRELLYYLDQPERCVERLQSPINSPVSRRFAFRCELDDDWSATSGYLESQ